MTYHRSPFAFLGRLPECAGAVRLHFGAATIRLPPAPGRVRRQGSNFPEATQACFPRNSLDCRQMDSADLVLRNLSLPTNSKNPASAPLATRRTAARTAGRPRRTTAGARRPPRHRPCNARRSRSERCIPEDFADSGQPNCRVPSQPPHSPTRIYAANRGTKPMQKELSPIATMGLYRDSLYVLISALTTTFKKVYLEISKGDQQNLEIHRKKIFFG